MNKFTAADATALTKSEEAYTPKGIIIDAIKAAARKGKSTISVAEYRLSDSVTADLQEDGFLVGIGGISWNLTEVASEA